MNDPLIGRMIDDKYRIDAAIGAGGMATIYRATRLRIGDVVAIKILHPELLREPHFAERFEREARAAATLKHPNVVAIYDFGVSEDGVIYLVMELVEGRNLRAIIKDEGPMSATAALAIIRPVCVALTEAQRQHIVHRDIKPANIAVEATPDGPRVKVLDFGIASLRGGTMMTFTQTGALIGTPAYMSPEQCMGEELDGRSDVYSLGVVLFEMLCGVVPFNSPTPTAVVMQHVSQAPPALRVLNASVSPAVEAVVLRALAKRREDRFQTARELADALTAAVGRAGVPIHEIAGAPFSASQIDRTMVHAPLRDATGSAAPARRGHGLGFAVGLVAAAVLVTIGYGAQRLFVPPPSRDSAIAAARPSPVHRSKSQPVLAQHQSAIVVPRAASSTSDSPLTADSMLPLLRATPALNVSTQPNGAGAYVTVPETPARGMAVPSRIWTGRMADGRPVGIVPLDSGGAMGIGYALMWVWTDGRAQFVGEIPAENDGYGRLSMSVQNGEILVSWPTYAPSDGKCCPSLLRTKVLTLDGIRLRPLSDHVVANP